MEETQAPDTGAPEPSTGPIRVVIVDDHPMVREWTCNSLAAADRVTVVGVAENGHQGLEIIRNVVPNVVILDIHLPDLSGIEIARRLRATMPSVAVVVLTSYDDATYAQALLQIGVRGFLNKAASGAEIERAVRDAAAGRTTVRSDAARAAVGTDQAKLSGRERQVLLLLVAGRNNLDIANELGLSVHVVEHHVSQLLTALDARSRPEVIQKAYEYGIVPPSTTFVKGQPAVPALKIYHGYRDARRGTFLVQVQEGEQLRLLAHNCESEEIPGCHSLDGWRHGFGGYGGLELARWMLADCLGAEYLKRADVLPQFKTAMLTGLHPDEWAITEASIRTWATEHRIAARPSAPRGVVPSRPVPTAA